MSNWKFKASATDAAFLLDSTSMRNLAVAKLSVLYPRPRFNIARRPSRPQKGPKWQSSALPAVGASRRYRGLPLHHRSHQKPGSVAIGVV